MFYKSVLVLDLSNPFQPTLRDSAVAVLCKTAHKYASSPASGEEAVSQLFPIAETLRLLGTLISSTKENLKSPKLKVGNNWNTLFLLLACSLSLI